MTPIEIIVMIGALTLVVFTVVYNVIKRKKGGGCSGNCGSCSGCSMGYKKSSPCKDSKRK